MAAVLAVGRPDPHNPRVLDRFLRGPDGFIRYWRLVVVLAGCILMAMFGGALIWVAPAVTDSNALRGVWVLFAVGALKLPLILLLWSFIRRNREWPGRRPHWSDEEFREILDRIADQAAVVDLRRDGTARLAHLSREAWHIADQVEGGRKVDALTVALRIDERLMVASERETA